MYRLNEATPDDALSAFVVSARDLALAHVALVALRLPEGEADIQDLGPLAAALTAAYLDWFNKARLQDEALVRRNGSHAEVLAVYGAHRDRLKYVVKRISGGSNAAPLLKLCPPPSKLRSTAALLLALQAMGDGITAHAALLASVNVDAAAVQADLAARHASLTQAAAALTAADTARSAASQRRDQAHADALAQVRLVVGAMELELPDDARAELDRLRILHLPYYAPPRARDAEPAQ